MECNEKILLCKRAIEPRLGFWTLPSGYMENDETVLEAAIRETQEETNVVVKGMHLYIVFSCPNINQVYCIFRGSTENENACATEESTESKYFLEHEVPWGNLSYSIMNKAISLYFEDKVKQNFDFRVLDEYGCDQEHSHQ